ncbi:MAG TPA: lipopolysaccharide biosynthesis protein [Burkholderiaceae bacterium]|nr:lipopolysaccharide biosynthesis protein [Burkholderiaceae bacterium]
MTTEDPIRPAPADAFDEDDGPHVDLTQALIWVGQGKRLIATATVAAAIVGVAAGLLWPKIFTAHASLLAPGTQQQSGAAAALSALGALGGLGAGLGAKTPDELYVALLKSDSVQRALADRYDLKTRYDAKTYEALRKTMPNYIRVASDKKSGLISVDVDDLEPAFAAELANAHAVEVNRLLGRLAVSEAQLRRVFFEKQLNDTKENLIRAEQNLRTVQEKSGVIVLDKQAEALITSAAQVRAQIAAREVQLKVLRTGATEQNPDVIRLTSELRALRAELARMESTPGANAGSAIDMPIGKLPEAGVEYVRARRELKLQETLLEAMLRQFEAAKLDEAKEGVGLQVVDRALPPDRKSKPSGLLIALGCTLAALLLSSAFVVMRGYRGWADAQFPERAAARSALARAWRWRG